MDRQVGRVHRAMDQTVDQAVDLHHHGHHHHPNAVVKRSCGKFHFEISDFGKRKKEIIYRTSSSEIVGFCLLFIYMNCSHFKSATINT